MVDIDFLRKVGIFKGLEDDQLALILENCQEKEFPKGGLLFKEGQEAHCIWLVVDGEVDLRFDLPARPTTSKETTLNTETTSNTLGWSAFVPPYRYVLSAYCTSESCKVAQLEKADLLTLFEEDPGMGYSVMSNLAGVVSTRFHKMQQATPDKYAITTIVIHMATCGIVAGAREVMTALMEEMAITGRKDIHIRSSGCIGKCATEPNVTVEIEGAEPVIYQEMTPDKMRHVFQQHVLKGDIATEYLL
ncbi:MAG: cyclic nucleotide-binding domain-containing protein [Desulfobacterales bacterium]